MKTFLLAGFAAGALILAGPPALAADAAHGQQLFRAQCGVCHQAGGPARIRAPAAKPARRKVFMLPRLEIESSRKAAGAAGPDQRHSTLLRRR